MNKEEKKDSIAFQAEIIGHKVLTTLKSPKDENVVRGVFDHALYIGDGGTLVKVITDKEFISPTSIALGESDDLSFKLVGIKEGMTIIANGSKLNVRGNGFSIDLENAPTWHPPKLSELATNLIPEEMSLNLRVLRDLIYTCPSRAGLVPLVENVELYGPLNVYLREQKPSVSEKARPYIERLMWGLFSGELETVTKNAQPILGLGPGLTPSCDDFLAGLILSLNLGAQILLRNEGHSLGFFRKVSAEILSMAKNKTTIYSLSFLKEASLGEGPKPVVDLICSVISESADQVAKVSKTLISMGGTSGADIAIGICYGIRFLISRIELKELNETA